MFYFGTLSKLNFDEVNAYLVYSEKLNKLKNKKSTMAHDFGNKSI